jgi:hypothetical protein
MNKVPWIVEVVFQNCNVLLRPEIKDQSILPPSTRHRVTGTTWIMEQCVRNNRERMN